MQSGLLCSSAMSSGGTPRCCAPVSNALAFWDAVCMKNWFFASSIALMPSAVPMVLMKAAVSAFARYCSGAGRYGRYFWRFATMSGRSATALKVAPSPLSKPSIVPA
jgi:hypothetical protein